MKMKIYKPMVHAFDTRGRQSMDMRKILNEFFSRLEDGFQQTFFLFITSRTRPRVAVAQSG
jgi:hypothetical protein